MTRLCSPHPVLSIPLLPTNMPPLRQQSGQSFFSNTEHRRPRAPQRGNPPFHRKRWQFHESGKPARGGDLTQANAFPPGPPQFEDKVCIAELAHIHPAAEQQRKGSQDRQLLRKKPVVVRVARSLPTSYHIPAWPLRQGVHPVGCFMKAPPHSTSTFRSTQLAPQPQGLQPRYLQKPESCQGIAPKLCCYPHRHPSPVPTGQNS